MKKTIGIIGGGNMGTALIQALHKRYRVGVCETDPQRRSTLAQKFNVKAQELQALVNENEIIILAVKPQTMEDVLCQIKDTEGKLFISIAAGLTTRFFAKRLAKDARIIRTMPNMPAQIGEGITAVCKGRHATASDVKVACEILGRVGEVVVVDERDMDAVTALSGSGPAYVFLFIECLQKSAKALGLKQDLADPLIRQTLFGSLKQWQQFKEDPSELRKKVTSKGGTTEAAMKIFLSNKIDHISQMALVAAKRRAKSLSKS